MVLRPARPEDAEALLRLMAELGPTHQRADELGADLRDLSHDPASLVVVAEQSGVVVGFVYAHMIRTLIRPGGWARLASMAVAPSHRRQGVGTELVRAAEEFAASRGAESVELTSGNQREDAHALYRHLGYQITSGSTWFAKGL